MARPSHSDHVLCQLNSQREWGFLCDCLVAVGDTVFRAHKAVLAACSRYFSSVFIRDQQHAQEGGRVDLSHMQISAESFDLILQLMYLGRVSVGGRGFTHLKAAMSLLQMYYIPDSLEDLRDIRSSALTPSSSSSSSSSSCLSSGGGGGKMMFGVRMYEQKQPSNANANANANGKAVSSSTGRAAAVMTSEEVVLLSSAPSTAQVDTAQSEQPCDLRKRPNGSRGSSLKERPRFGRTYTCDDCGFVFSCEKLLIEHILTCTNRTHTHTHAHAHTHARARTHTHTHAHTDAETEDRTAESSTSESESSRAVCKGEDDWSAAGSDPFNRISIKTEPQEASVAAEIEMVRVGEEHPIMSPAHCSSTHTHTHTDAHTHTHTAVGSTHTHTEHTSGSLSDTETGVLCRQVKIEPLDEETDSPSEQVEDDALDSAPCELLDSAPCELCGALLSEEEQSAHYLSTHLTSICACGRCGQVLIKGRALQEHAERCGEIQDGGESDSSAEGEGPEGEGEGPNLEEEEEEEPNMQEGEGPNEDMDLSCSLSDEMFLRPSGEQDHRRKHFCSICGKGFFQRCHLREHYTVHTREKQFTCLTCGKKFLRERQLRLHTDMHRGVARYTCPVCEQGTFLKHDHVRHMISHLTDTQTLCQVCFQICGGAEQLQKHMDVHLYTCGVCGDKFRLRKDMRSHYNATHTKRL